MQAKITHAFHKARDLNLALLSSGPFFMLNQNDFQMQISL